MLLLLNREKVFGNLNIHGHINFVHVVQMLSNVNIIYIIIKLIYFEVILSGCFAFFCPCCFECELYERAGESMWTCICPGAGFALRSKIRTAFRIEVIFLLCVINLKKRNYSI